MLPRELNIDEIKQMAEHCPKPLGLELFVHGALCYGISGRCYWSSYMGGKSGASGKMCAALPQNLQAGRPARKVFFLSGFKPGCVDQGAVGCSANQDLENRGPQKGPPLCVLYRERLPHAPGSWGVTPRPKRMLCSFLNGLWEGPALTIPFCLSVPKSPSRPMGIPVPACCWGGCGEAAQTPSWCPGNPFFRGIYFASGMRMNPGMPPSKSENRSQNMGSTF